MSVKRNKLVALFALTSGLAIGATAADKKQCEPLIQITGETVLFDADAGDTPQDLLNALGSLGITPASGPSHAAASPLIQRAVRESELTGVPFEIEPQLPIKMKALGIRVSATLVTTPGVGDMVRKMDAEVADWRQQLAKNSGALNFQTDIPDLTMLEKLPELSRLINEIQEWMRTRELISVVENGAKAELPILAFLSMIRESSNGMGHGMDLASANSNPIHIFKVNVMNASESQLQAIRENLAKKLTSLEENASAKKDEFVESIDEVSIVSIIFRVTSKDNIAITADVLTGIKSSIDEALAQ